MPGDRAQREVWDLECGGWVGHQQVEPSRLVPKGWALGVELGFTGWEPGRGVRTWLGS